MLNFVSRLRSLVWGQVSKDISETNLKQEVHDRALEEIRLAVKNGIEEALADVPAMLAGLLAEEAHERRARKPRVELIEAKPESNGHVSKNRLVRAK